MRKIKKFWNKLKCWQKGGIVGFIVSLVFVIINTFIVYGGLGLIIFYPINWFLFDFFNLFNLRNCGESCWGVTILIGNIEFIGFITLIGLLIGLIIQKSEKNEIKTTKKLQNPRRRKTSR